MVPKNDNDKPSCSLGGNVLAVLKEIEGLALETYRDDQSGNFGVSTKE